MSRITAVVFVAFTLAFSGAQFAFAQTNTASSDNTQQCTAGDYKCQYGKNADGSLKKDSDGMVCMENKPCNESCSVDGVSGTIQGACVSQNKCGAETTCSGQAPQQVTTQQIQNAVNGTSAQSSNAVVSQDFNDINPTPSQTISQDFQSFQQQGGNSNNQLTPQALQSYAQNLQQSPAPANTIVPYQNLFTQAYDALTGTTPSSPQSQTNLVDVPTTPEQYLQSTFDSNGNGATIPTLQSSAVPVTPGIPSVDVPSSGSASYFTPNDQCNTSCIEANAGQLVQSQVPIVVAGSQPDTPVAIIRGEDFGLNQQGVAIMTLQNDTGYFSAVDQNGVTAMLQTGSNPQGTGMSINFPSNDVNPNTGLTLSQTVSGTVMGEISTDASNASVVQRISDTWSDNPSLLNGGTYSASPSAPSIQVEVVPVSEVPAQPQTETAPAAQTPLPSSPVVAVESSPLAPIQESPQGTPVIPEPQPAPTPSGQTSPTVQFAPTTSSPQQVSQLPSPQLSTPQGDQPQPNQQQTATPQPNQQTSPTPQQQNQAQPQFASTVQPNLLQQFWCTVLGWFGSGCSAPSTTQVAQTTPPPASQPTAATQPTVQQQPASSQPSSPTVTPNTPTKVSATTGSNTGQPGGKSGSSGSIKSSGNTGATASNSGTANSSANTGKITTVIPGKTSSGGTAGAQSQNQTTASGPSVLTSPNGTQSVAQSGTNPNAGGTAGTPGVKTGGTAAGNTGTNPNNGTSATAPNQQQTVTAQNGNAGQSGAKADTTNNNSPNPSTTPGNQTTNTNQNGQGGGTGGTGTGNGSGTGNGNGSQAGTQGNGSSLLDQMKRDVVAAGDGLRTFSKLVETRAEGTSIEKSVIGAGISAAQHLSQTIQGSLGAQLKEYVARADQLNDIFNSCGSNKICAGFKGASSLADEIKQTGEQLLPQVKQYVNNLKAASANPNPSAAIGPIGVPAPSPRSSITGETTGSTPLPPPFAPSVQKIASADTMLQYNSLSSIRSRFAQELQNPQVRGLLMASTEAEVGGQGQQTAQAYMESVMNRAAASNRTLAATINDPAYYPPTTINKLGQIPSAAQQQQLNTDITAVLAGSNISNLATGNESGPKPCFGACVAIAFNPGTGERFVVESSTSNWVNTTRSALGLPTLGTFPTTVGNSQYKGGTVPTPTAQVAAARVPGLTSATTCSGASGICATDPTTGATFTCQGDKASCLQSLQQQLALSRLCASNTATCSTTAGTYTETATNNVVPLSPQQVQQKIDDYLWSHMNKSSLGTIDQSAKQAGLTPEQYAIGGMDPNFRTNLYFAGQAMDKAGVTWGIENGYRSDYNQQLICGSGGGSACAPPGWSYHGGSIVTGGYGHGLAADITGPGQTWLLQNGQQYGIGHPYSMSYDAPHFAPTDSPEYIKQQGQPSVNYQSALSQEQAQLATMFPQQTYTLTDSNGNPVLGQNGQPVTTTQAPSGSGTGQFLTNPDGSIYIDPSTNAPVPVNPPQLTQDATNPNQYNAPDDRPPQPAPTNPWGTQQSTGFQPSPTTNINGQQYCLINANPATYTPCGGQASSQARPPAYAQPPQQTQPISQASIAAMQTPQLSCSPSNVPAATSTPIIISWSCLYGTPVSNGFSTNGNPSGQTTILSPQGATSTLQFALTCVDPTGVQPTPPPAMCTVGVSNAQATTSQAVVTIIANPTTVASSSTSLISWSSVGTLSCQVGPENGALIGTSTTGSAASAQLSTTTMFIASCETQASTTISATTTVTVN